MCAVRYVAIANPDGKRWQAYSRDLSAFWEARGVLAGVEVVPWRDVVQRDGNLDGLAAFDRPALVRLESPGRDFEVARLLLEAGGRAIPGEPTDWSHLVYEKGRLTRPGLMYAGFKRVLTGLKASFDARPHLKASACPLDVAVLFDKNATSARLDAAGIPSPPSLPGLPSSTIPSELQYLIREEGFRTAYVKLNTGSSASAIVVLSTHNEDTLGVGSIVLLGEGFYSTRRLCHYDPGCLRLAAVLDFLLREGVCVQEGIRMAQIDGENFDVRVVVIHGRPAFTIFRLSSLPMTNLHLGGRRGDPQRCRAAIPTRAWLDAIDHCVEAAAQFQSNIVGVDLLFETGYMRHFILEANAFGDFFPGLVDAQGRSVHSVEIEETARRHGLL
jgi:hypothetical protein